MRRQEGEPSIRRVARLTYGASAMAVIAIAMLAITDKGSFLAIGGVTSALIAIGMAARAIMLTRSTSSGSLARGAPPERRHG